VPSLRLVLSDYRAEDEVSLCFELQVYLALSPSGSATVCRSMYTCSERILLLEKLLQVAFPIAHCPIAYRYERKLSRLGPPISMALLPTTTEGEPVRVKV
jgi:hypothetical protein